MPATIRLRAPTPRRAASIGQSNFKPKTTAYPDFEVLLREPVHEVPKDVDQALEQQLARHGLLLVLLASNKSGAAAPPRASPRLRTSNDDAGLFVLLLDLLLRCVANRLHGTEIRAVACQSNKRSKGKTCSGLAHNHLSAQHTLLRFPDFCLMRCAMRCVRSAFVCWRMMCLGLGDQANGPQHQPQHNMC